ncbi:hypothetical protein BDY19DRAFT_895703 [Irpex rosettiformis]|uniref:Uncharacterized protein n=1 Tax=Irpex rosettiformis TaxID=378272 RepID=A0ACB8TV69_9APHY|nr:hypothetical protein BDY19DRAFT_895703 [Irpex rosettiformis]
MHAGGSTLPDLMISLWRASIKCDSSDDKSTWEWAVLRETNAWKAHGALVAAVTPYLPGSFDRPPRNPAEKINSGYKAVEFIHYVFGVGPALLYGVLPFRYWQNYCRLVRGWRLMNPPNRKLTPEHLREAHKQFILFLEEFEELYYQRNPSRIHFIRQSIHGLAHLAPEVVRVGPPTIYSQWTMERVIGDLGSEIRQPSNPFSNLSQRALRRCQLNAIKHMVPTLGDDTATTQLPRGACNLGHGYALLRAVDDKEREVRPCEAVALQLFFRNRDSVSADWLVNPRVKKWARVLLPNGTKARSRWKEALKPLTKVRMARMIKVRFFPSLIEYAEVLYYFKLDFSEGPVGFAMVSVCSKPDTDLLSCSVGVVSSLQHRGDDGLAVIDISSILSTLALPPQPVVTAERLAQLGYPASAPPIEDNRFYTYEKGDDEIDSFRDVSQVSGQDNDNE